MAVGTGSGAYGLKVNGIREVRSALRKIGDAEQLAEVREGLRAAADIVVQDAKRRVPVVTGRARDSLRATVGGNNAYVNGGKASVPYFGWLDFGSREPILGRPRSVGPWAKPAPRGPEIGRFIYPALYDNEAEVAQAVEDALWKVAQKEDLT